MVTSHDLEPCLRETEHALATARHRPTPALRRLEHRLAGTVANRRSPSAGIVNEIAPAYYRVSGLSRIREARRVRESGGRPAASARRSRPHRRGRRTIKPFDDSSRRGSAISAWRRGFITLSPDAPGRPHHQRARQRRSTAGPAAARASSPLDRPRAACAHAAPAGAQAAADRHQRHRSLHPDLRRTAHRHLRRLGHRQINAACHARPFAGFDTSSSRWSASAAAKCASSSRRRWPRQARARSSSSPRAMKAR